MCVRDFDGKATCQAFVGARLGIGREACGELVDFGTELGAIQAENLPAFPSLLRGQEIENTPRPRGVQQDTILFEV